MKKCYLLWLLVCLVASCSQVEDPGYPVGEEKNIGSQYDSSKEKIVNSIESQVSYLGWTTKSNSAETMMGIIEDMPIGELRDLITENSIDIFETKLDNSLENLSNEYTSSDLNILNNSIEEYVKAGGHNTSLLMDICKDMPSQLIEVYVYIAAYADCMASKDFWLWLSSSNTSNDTSGEMKKIVPIGGGGSSLEFNCRQIFWNSLRLIALNAGSDYLVSTLTGPVMPEADVLVTCANLLGAGAAALDYYACCRGGVL